MTILDILALKVSRKDASETARRLSMLTAYDATSARLVERAGVDMILVGDSLAMTMQGKADTNAVTIEEMIYHTKIVVQNAPNTLIVADMPFLSYEISPEQALESAGKLCRESGARAVKLEGGRSVAAQVKALTTAGIPVMGHLGLTPQRAANFGGFKAQARDAMSAFELIEDAYALQEAGCFSLVLEAIPEVVASYLTEKLDIPTIGIGAGAGCDGQVLVFHDMLGISDFTPRFVKKYAECGETMVNAIQEYIKDIEEQTFPQKCHTFSMKEGEEEKFLGNRISF